MKSFLDRMRNKLKTDIEIDVQSVDRKNNFINFSNTIYIELPKVELPKYTTEERTQEYWNHFNSGVSHYQKKQFLDAKNEFLILINQNPHKGLNDYLLRTYRKIYKKEIEKAQYQNAINVMDEFFQIFKEFITDNDRRNYNKVVDKLSEDNENIPYRTFEIGGKTKVPDFTIKTENKDLLTLIDIIDTITDKYSKRRKWRYVEKINNSFIIYINSIYNTEKSCFTESIIQIRDSEGNILKEQTLNHGIYHFRAAEKYNYFVATSDDLLLYLYSIKGDCIGTYNLKRYSTDKYHIRCVDISKDGQIILFTHIDKVYFLDSNFNIIKTIRIPPKDGALTDNSKKQELAHKEYQQYLSYLNLNGNPTIEQIKSSFKRKIKQCHPDLNPDNFDSPYETRKIIEAYEKLTNDDAIKVFQNYDDEAKYYQIVNSIKMEFKIPGLSNSFSAEISIVFPGEDWIYSTFFGDNIYLGCYSGKVYRFSSNYIPYITYEAHESIRNIKEINDYIFIQTHHTLFIIKDDKYIGHIDKWKLGEGSFRYFECCLIYKGTKYIKIYNWDGSIICEIKFKNSIYDIFEVESNLSVITKNKTFTFTINKQANN